MSTLILEASLPWSGLQEEDRRFRRILAYTLVVSLIIGIITPVIQIPQPDTGSEQELPPRRVRLLAEPIEPPELKPRAVPLTMAATVTPSPRQSIPQRTPVAPAVTPRQKAAGSGVLAMSNALVELQTRSPKAGAPSSRITVDVEEEVDARQSSALIANLTRGSGGIEGGVAHQSVLGAPGLPGWEESGQSSTNGGSSAAVRGLTTSGPPGVARSQEEIQELLDRNKGAMYTLYHRELRREPGLQGKLVMSITIAPAGHVTRCIILSSELDSISLEQQLVVLVGGIDFGNKPGVPAVTTKIPIEFFPQ